MVRNNAHRTVRGFLLAVLGAGPSGDSRKQRCKEIAVVIAVDTLGYGNQPLEPHPCVDARPRQRVKSSGGVSVVLHEDEIPDLNHPVALTVGPIVAGHGRALVKVNF